MAKPVYDHDAAVIRQQENPVGSALIFGFHVERSAMTITDNPAMALLVWSGTLGAAEDEIFSYHRYIGLASAPDLEEVLDSAANDVTDLLAESATGTVPYETLAGAFPDTVAWTLLKGYHFDEATGEITSEPSMRVLTDVGVTSGVKPLPNQDSLAITTRKLPRGRASFNRFYLPPMISSVMTADGHVIGETIDDIQTQLKFANAAHRIDTPSWEYGVYSPSEHTIQQIESYYTGDVMDTHRRRRNKLVETRHVLAG